MRAILPVLFGAVALFGADTADLSQAQIDDVIQKFAAKEAAFAKARENYTYKQTVRFAVLDSGGRPAEKWDETSEIVFTNEGKRTEHVTFSPVNTLKRITLEPEDLEDIRNVQPFVLTSAELPKYLIRYLGKDTLDEISCYAFAVKPKKLEPGQRYFQGIVWVDDRDLQIVKSYGRGTGIKRNKTSQYAKFETYRQQIDGVYWFPTYTISESTLHFPDDDVPIRQTIKYEDYKQFRSDVKITFGDEVQQKEDKKHPEPPKRP